MPGLDWEEQEKLVDDCISSGKLLHAELLRRGLSYDDLRYQHNPPLKESSGRYIPFEEYPRSSNKIPLMSFFSGCGGMDLGFEAAGFQHVACIDNNELFCNTLRLNRPMWNVIGPPESAGDVSKRQDLYEELRGIANEDFNGVFIGGPPCQPFSIAANQRFARDNRKFKRIGFAHEANGHLLFDYAWFIKKFRPEVFLLENVPGLATIDNREQIRRARSYLTDMGYVVSESHVLDAADYGVPQRRKRLFIVGSRKGTFLFPAPNQTMIPCYQPLSQRMDGVKNHVTRNHKAESVRRYMILDCGQRDKLGRVDRLDPNLPSKTVIAGGAEGGGRSHLHPFLPRTLSVRECARLQTFPDSFVFQGSIARQFTQVGNAVPPALAYRLARSIAHQFFGK